MDLDEAVRSRVIKAVELTRTDPEGIKLAHKMNEGKILVTVGSTVCIPVVCKDGRLDAVSDPSHPRAVCSFADPASALDILDRRLSRYSATVHGLFVQKGLSPMNDTFEKILLLAGDREREGK